MLFVGEEGVLMADYDQRKLFPEEKFADFTPPPNAIPGSIGHHREWLVGCKAGSPTTSNFGYSGPLTETALVANISYRSGDKFYWNAARLEAVSAQSQAIRSPRIPQRLVSVTQLPGNTVTDPGYSLDI